MGRAGGVLQVGGAELFGPAPAPGPNRTQDRLAEKTLFRDLGLPVGDFIDVRSLPELQAAVGRVGLPCILKTRRLGYDGKGQFRIRTDADIQTAWDTLGAQVERTGLILEGFVHFDRELSVIAVRTPSGAFRAWPVSPRLTGTMPIAAVRCAGKLPATP